MQSAYGCERCGQPKASYQQLQCSHYHKRRKLATRWDEDNCAGLCFGCHQYFEENREEYTAWMMQRLGQTNFNMLEGRARNTHPNPDRKAIELYYKEMLKGLRDGS